VRPKLLSLLLITLALPLQARELAQRVAPSWVQRVDADAAMVVAKENVRWGLYDILRDHQVRVHGGGQSNYYRTVRKVLSPSGVSNASELELDFDPTYQKLTVHEVAVVRGGKRVNALDLEDVRIIDKEDDASNRIYDGIRTALIFIKDVRPGDVIDYSWSIDGANPILDGRYTDEYDLSTGVPTRQLRHRLVWPAARTLRWRGAQPVVLASGDSKTLIWEKRDIKGLDMEDELPSWYEPWLEVQVSEFGSWNEVARWSEAMFRLDEPSTKDVKALAATIRKEHATPDAQVTAAIRFVQDDIRYLGIEMGRNSHEPHQPSETLAGRWGDCKDKAFLLSALLRELGLDAWPALVHSRLEHRLGDKLPSPFVFDHVITQVVSGGKTYWIDGTISDQGGTLATMETPNYGRALVIRADTTGLTQIATRDQGSVAIEQTYTTTSYKEPTKLVVTKTYTGAEADGIRSWIASMSLDDYAVERLNALAADQPKITAAGSPTIQDDRARNVVVVTEQYRVAGLWDGGDWTWYPRDLDRHFRRPDTMIRKMPLAFEYPLNVRQEVTFEFPEDIDVTPSTSLTETPTFRYDYIVDGGGKTVTIKQSLVARKDSVAVADVAEHLTKLNSIWDEIGYRLAPPSMQETVQASAAAGDIQQFFSAIPVQLRWLGGLGLVALFVGISVFASVRGRRQQTRVSSLARAGGFRPGEAPAVALAARSGEEIARHLALIPCFCGARVHSAHELQRALYDEQEMTIATRQCGACGREQSVYFRAA
jgi:transglutaminase-like putative cysteine protease